MEHKITVTKYQVTFPRMTKKLFDEHENIYQITVINIRLNELQKKGAALQKIGKPTKNGTKMTFAPLRAIRLLWSCRKSWVWNLGKRRNRHV